MKIVVQDQLLTYNLFYVSRNCCKAIYNLFIQFLFFFKLKNKKIILKINLFNFNL